MFKLASLFVDITARDADFKKNVGGLKGELTKMGVAIGTAAGTLAASAISRASAAVTGFFAGGIKGAIDLKETLSKVTTIFGDSASIITGQADVMAEKFGVVKGEFLNAASDFGSAFKAIGTAAPEAAALGNQLAKLGMDMASFNNASNEEAFTALRAALRGEFDPLERFNVMLSAAAIEQEALNLGLIRSGREMDEAAKKQATLSLVMKKTTDQQGDMERTADGSANSWRKLTGSLENLATSMGEALEPAINSLIGLGNELATSLAAGFQASRSAFAAFADGVIDAVHTIGATWRNLPEVWAMVQLRFRELVGNFVAGLASIPENARIVGTWFANNWVNLLKDAFNAATTILTNFGENIYKLGDAIRDWLSGKGFHVDFTPLLKDFEAVTEALPELAKPAWVDLSADYQAAIGRMATVEQKHLEDAAAKARDVAGPAKAAATAAAQKVKEFKSEMSGASEFLLKMRSAIYEALPEPGGGGARKRPLKKSERRAAELATKKRARIAGSRSRRLAARADRRGISKRGMQDAATFAEVARAALADDTPKKSLEEQKKTRMAAERTADALSRGLPAVLG